MIRDTVSDLPSQIKSLTIVLKRLHYANTLLVMCKLGVEALLHSVFSRVSKRRVADIVPKSRRLGKILIKAQASRYDTSYLRNLKRMRHTRSIMVSGRSKKHLRFIHKPPEGLAVQYFISVTLKFRADLTRNVGFVSTASL